MLGRDGRFNCILAAGLLLAGGATACRSPEEKRASLEASTLRLYLETDFDTTGEKTAVVPVYRASPVLLRVAREPFLDEGHIVDAQVVDTVGGFAIAVRYDFHGALVLDTVSSTYRGQRIAIHSTFTEARWLAAPKMATPIKDGLLVFTPDATREEAERLVRGLNNVAVKLGNRPKPTKTKPPKSKPASPAPTKSPSPAPEPAKTPAPGAAPGS